MVLVIDILSTLNSCDRALARAELGSLLDVDVHELDGPLQIGVAGGLIRPGSGEWAADPASAVDLFTITDAGRERYGAIVDRFAQQIVGPPELSIAERFILAVSESRPDPLRRAVIEIVDDPRLAFTGEVFERQRAQWLAARALGRWAQAALDSREGSETRAAGLRSLALGDLDAIGYAAGIARDDYAPAVDGALREIVLAAADAGESAWQLRQLAPRGQDGISHARPFEPSAARELAEHAALALTHAGDAGLVDLLREVKLGAECMRRSG